MALRSLLPEGVERYIGSLVRESDLRRRLRAFTRALPDSQARMQVGPDQAALLALFARLLGARRAIEVGTFTGMSSRTPRSTTPTPTRCAA
jgi:predicted O-methyltransferase YrrM